MKTLFILLATLTISAYGAIQTALIGDPEICDLVLEASGDNPDLVFLERNSISGLLQEFELNTSAIGVAELQRKIPHAEWAHFRKVGHGILL